MGSWDELCLLCGVYGGPYDIVSRYALDDVAKAIATDIRPNDPKLFEIIKEALLVSLPPAQRTIGYSPEWLPAGMGNNGYSSGAWVAVGHFDAYGEAPLSHGRILDGRDVQVRRVQNGDGGEFTELLVADKHGEETAETTYSVCSVKREEGRSNFFLCERCYAYLDNWLDRESLPTSSRASGSDCELSLASELYEIVNSRKVQRDEDTGLLPEIDYDGIESSLTQWQTQFMPCRKGTKHIAEAVEAGLRGADLLPAVLRDCRGWMFMRPDIWPEPPKIARTPTFAAFPPTHDSTPVPLLGQLPNELLLPILHDLPLPSLLALSATCRALRTLITAPDFLDRVLKEAITRGSLRWVLPLEGLLDEAQRAYEALRLWLPEPHRPAPFAPPEDSDDSDSDDSDPDAEGSDDSDVEPAPRAPRPSPPPVAPLLTSPHFDRLAFMHACWASDAMMNRKRLWGQVKRFEPLWADYRLHGWQVDRFYALRK